MTKPCVNCGADQPADFKQYHGFLGYEAIICLVCGHIYDHAGAHERDRDERSILYVHVDQAALERRMAAKRRQMEQQDVEADDTCCPFCKSEDIEGDGVEISAGSASQECTCHDCHAGWRAVYNLARIEIIDSGDQAPAPADAQSQTIGG